MVTFETMKFSFLFDRHEQTLALRSQKGAATSLPNARCNNAAKWRAFPNPVCYGDGRTLPRQTATLLLTLGGVGWDGKKSGIAVLASYLRLLQLGVDAVKLKGSEE